MKLIIQIPCYNEAETLRVALDHLPRHIDGVDEIEILIINDGSTDRTVEVAREWGVQHIVSFKQNRGLARGFMAGIDACLHLGADIIVNTDADDQYRGEDIERLVRPILEKKADIVIGERPIDETEHFSKKKKMFQHLGSWVVRVASNTEIPDAPSGFRAYSREGALRLNVVNDYSYTLETIIQAGWNRIPMTSVPVRTNPELRPSRLFKSMWRYMKRSSSVILRAFAMYKPLRFFGIIGGGFFGLGVLLGVAIAVVLWWSGFVSRVAEPYLVVLNSLPKIALGPVIIIVVGAGTEAIIFMALAISLIVTVLEMLAGFRSTNPESIKMARTFGATKRQVFTKIVFPSNINTLFNSLKINIGLSLVGVIAGEFLVSKAGLGYLIVYGGQVFKLDLVMASVFVLCVLAAGMYAVVAAIEKFCLKGRGN